MQFGQIEAFVEIASVCNITRAAETLCLTQPTVTARLQTLESEVGQELFTREKYGMRLTEAGKTFLPYAQRSLQALRDGTEALGHLRDATGGKITIGSTPFISTYLLPSLLKCFRSAYPSVHIAVHTGHSEEVVAAVLHEEVQIGLVGRARHVDIESEKLHEDELVLVVPPHHPFAFRPSIQIDDLSHEAIVLFDRTSPYYELTKSVLFNAGVAPQTAMELDTVEAAKKMVEEGMGVSLLPRIAITRELTMGTLKEVPIAEAPTVKREMLAIYRKGIEMSGITRAFLQTVEAAEFGV